MLFAHGFYAGGMSDSAEPDVTPETLAELGSSFSYGSRTDLTFKFLARFEADEVGEVVRRVFEYTGALFDDPDPGELVDYVRTIQAEGYHRRQVNERYRYDDGPFTAPTKPLSESTVALVTSSGHFLDGDDPRPFGVDAMTQREAVERIGDFLKEAPTLSEIPIAAIADEIRVRHGGYDIRGSLADHNVSLPIDRLRELEADGEIGAVHPVAYSFVGAAAQTRLVKTTAPEWADRLAASDIDVVLLVPV